MERMDDVEEMLRELSEKYKNSKSVEVYEEDLEGWFKIIDDLREENKKLNIIIENTKIEQKSDREHIEELEEENKNLRAYADNLDSENDNQAIEIEELKKENKKLKSDLDKYKKYYDRDKEELMESCYSLAKENDELNIKVASLEGEIKGLNSVIDKLKEENQTLELWLDNKEKVNISLREELSAYDREYFDEDKKAKNIFIDKSGKVIKGGEFTTLC